MINKALLKERDKEINDLYSKVHDEKAILIHGPKGVGKTSFVKNGVTKLLLNTGWMGIYVEFYTDLFQSLLTEIKKYSKEKNENTENLTDLISKIQKEYGKPFYIIIDQFEQTSNEENFKEAFEALNKLINDSNLRCCIIFIIEDRDLPFLSRYERDFPKLFNQKFSIGHLSDSRISRVMETLSVQYGLAKAEEETKNEIIQRLKQNSDDILNLSTLHIYFGELKRRGINELINDDDAFDETFRLSKRQKSEVAPIIYFVTLGLGTSQANRLSAVVYDYKRSLVGQFKTVIAHANSVEELDNKLNHQHDRVFAIHFINSLSDSIYPEKEKDKFKAFFKRLTNNPIVIFNDRKDHHLMTDFRERDFFRNKPTFLLLPSEAAEKTTKSTYGELLPWFIEFYKQIGIGKDLLQGVINNTNTNIQQEKEWIETPMEVTPLNLLENPKRIETIINDSHFGLPPIPDEIYDCETKKEIQIEKPKIPFKGFKYFKGKDARIFFGRTKEIREIYRWVYDQNSKRIRLFYGQSGVGKSSLLFAGVLPRLHRDWIPLYYRRDKDKGADQQIKEIEEEIETLKEENKNFVLIFDQLEEIYTDKKNEVKDDVKDEKKDEATAFIEKIKALANDTSINIKIILSFRKEYIAEIKKLLKGVSLEVEESFLSPLSKDGIKEAIRGPLSLYDNVQIKEGDHQNNEESVVDEIANAIYTKGSQMAPLLQIILTKMWEIAAGNAHSNGGGTLIFDKATFDRVLKEGGLEQIVDEQMDKASRKLKMEDSYIFPPKLKKSLLLNLLHTMVSINMKDSLITATEEKEEFYLDKYSHIEEEKGSGLGILEVLDELKNVYLVIEKESKNETTKEKVKKYRLSHDALAPIVWEMYNESTYPGQKAETLLKSQLRANIEMNKQQVNLIKKGKLGMQRPNKEEQALIDRSKRKSNILMLIQCFLGSAFVALAIYSAYLLLKTNQTRFSITTATIKSKGISLNSAAQDEFNKGNWTGALYLLKMGSLYIDSIRLEETFFLGKIKGGALNSKKTISGGKPYVSSNGSYIVTTTEDNNTQISSSQNTRNKLLVSGASSSIDPNEKYILTTQAVLKDSHFVEKVNLFKIDGAPLKTFEEGQYSFGPNGQFVLCKPNSSPESIYLYNIETKDSIPFKAINGYLDPSEEIFVTNSTDSISYIHTIKKASDIIPIEGKCMTVGPEYIVTTISNNEKSGRKKNNSILLYDLSGKRLKNWQVNSFEDLTLSFDSQYVLLHKKKGKKDTEYKSELWQIEKNQAGVNLKFIDSIKSSNYAQFSSSGTEVIYEKRSWSTIIWNIPTDSIQLFRGINSKLSLDNKYLLTQDTKRDKIYYWRRQDTPKHKNNKKTFNNLDFDRFYLPSRLKYGSSSREEFEGNIIGGFIKNKDSLQNRRILLGKEYIYNSFLFELSKHELFKAKDGLVMLRNSSDYYISNNFNKKEVILKKPTDSIQTIRLDGNLGLFTPKGTYILNSSFSRFLFPDEPYKFETFLLNLDGEKIDTLKGELIQVSSGENYILLGKYIWDFYNQDDSLTLKNFLSKKIIKTVKGSSGEISVNEKYVLLSNYSENRTYFGALRDNDLSFIRYLEGSSAVMSTDEKYITSSSPNKREVYLWKVEVDTIGDSIQVKKQMPLRGDFGLVSNKNIYILTTLNTKNKSVLWDMTGKRLQEVDGVFGKEAISRLARIRGTMRNPLRILKHITFSNDDSYFLTFDSDLRDNHRSYLWNSRGDRIMVFEGFASFTKSGKEITVYSFDKDITTFYPVDTSSVKEKYFLENYINNWLDDTTNMSKEEKGFIQKKYNINKEYLDFSEKYKGKPRTISPKF